jgi:hypothetical protein
MKMTKTQKTDTAKYKPLTCYQCGDTMKSYSFNDVWDMRIDGKLHRVPVWSVPCHRCDACDIAVIDGNSDDQIMWSYNKYVHDSGLDTPWLLVRRFVRRRLLRLRDRWDFWVYKTFYKKDKRNAA